jgi:hypothetical protein
VLDGEPVHRDGAAVDHPQDQVLVLASVLVLPERRRHLYMAAEPPRSADQFNRIQQVQPAESPVHGMSPGVTHISPSQHCEGLQPAPSPTQAVGGGGGGDDPQAPSESPCARWALTAAAPTVMVWARSGFPGGT